MDRLFIGCVNIANLLLARRRERTRNGHFTPPIITSSGSVLIISMTSTYFDRRL